MTRRPCRRTLVRMEQRTARRNSRESGQVTLLVFRRKRDRLFTGVALELDIVEEGRDPLTLLQSLTEAVWLHVRGVVEDRLSNGLLNRPAPGSYWRIFDHLRTGHVPNTLHPFYFLFTVALPAMLKAKRPRHVTPRAPELASARR